MSSCSCSPESLVSVTFVNGTVLQRCPAHEAQRWLVDGRPVDVPIALSGLRSLFVEHRGVRGAGTASRPGRARRVIQLPPSPQPAAPGNASRVDSTTSNSTSAHSTSAHGTTVDDASLTALLHSRGLSGSWAVA